MNARIESMSHGDGKVYLQMVLDRMHPDAEVLLDARLKDGAKIPAHLFPFNPLEETSQANYVVVLPHFDVREVDLTFLGIRRGKLSAYSKPPYCGTEYDALAHALQCVCP